MWYESVYLRNVDDTLQNLRTKCLGLDTTFTDILPSHLRQASEERKAAQLADQLVYALAATSPDTSPEELARSRAWLYGITLLLLTECYDTDQTLLSIRTILDSSEAVRNSLLSKLEPHFMFPINNPIPNVLFKNYEILVLHLMTSCNIMKKHHEAFERVKEFLKSMDFTT